MNKIKDKGLSQQLNSTDHLLLSMDCSLDWREVSKHLLEPRGNARILVERNPEAFYSSYILLLRLRSGLICGQTDTLLTWSKLVHT